jgi:enoyl-CoA hydratase/carnithine racemase
VADYQVLKYEVRSGVAIITLNRPHVMNALDDQLEEELIRAFDEFDFDERAGVAIVTGAGPHFCVGADIKQRFEGDALERHLRRMDKGKSPEGYLGRTANWKPVIAAVQGHCLGAAFSIALEADLIVATEDARFGITENKRSMTGGRVWSKLQFFMASKVATEMFLTGEAAPAIELHRLGLINRLVPQDQHMLAAEQLAQRLLKVPPRSLREGVRVSRWPWVRMVAEADMYDRAIQLHRTADFDEAVRAFLEKREPVYSGH